MRTKTKFAAVAVALSVILSLASLTVGAAESGEESNAYISRSAVLQSERYELTVSKVYNKSIWAYTSLALTLNGSRVSTDARLINGTPYIAVRSFINAVTDMTVTYSSSARTLTVKGLNLEMEVIDGSNVIYANGRTLFSMTPSAVMTNGRMYAPLSSLAKALGLTYSYTASEGAVRLSGSVKPLTHGSRYYRDDEVYWFSRIISAESRGESLLGQIAVGSVVLNRVASSEYPNTVWGVIFDRKYGVQFSPVLDGSIYGTPTAVSVTAAKICLEGFNVNTSALFFLYPKNSSSSWIPNTRTYLFSIGKHDFYS